VAVGAVAVSALEASGGVPASEAGSVPESSFESEPASALVAADGRGAAASNALALGAAEPLGAVADIVGLALLLLGAGTVVGVVSILLRSTSVTRVQPEIKALPQVKRAALRAQTARFDEEVISECNMRCSGEARATILERNRAHRNRICATGGDRVAAKVGAA
jgi:hypothetical protein